MVKKFRGCRDSSGDFIPAFQCRGVKSSRGKHRKSSAKKFKSRPRSRGFWKSLFG